MLSAPAAEFPQGVICQVTFFMHCKQQMDPKCFVMRQNQVTLSPKSVYAQTLNKYIWNCIFLTMSHLCYHV